MPKLKPGPKPKPTMRACYVRLPQDIYARAEREAKVRIVDVSDILREWMLKGMNGAQA